MFVKKLVERATKKPVCYLETLKPEDVLPRISFHYGLPPTATMLAYDPLQDILALSTKHGQIKLLGKGNTQALLESDDAQPSKFLQFIPDYGVLFNVTSEDKIEVWDIERKILSHVHKSSEKITSFAAMLQCFFIFVGDSTGNISVWKINQESFHIEKMKYCINYSASHGTINKDAVTYPVSYILPQPASESKRLFLIYADGLMVLWAIQESKAICTKTGGSAIQLLSHETKKVTCACWVCPFGSKVAVGYNTGDILIYCIHPNSKTGGASLKCGDVCNAQIVLASKLNLGYKLDKIPIASLKWVYSNMKANRLYVMGACDATPMNLVQVILLSEESENQTNKLGLQLPEPCVDLEIISKNKEGFLILLGKSGRIYAYDDHFIEKYLLQSPKKSPLAAPIETIIKLPYYSSSVTSAQLCTNHYKTIGSSIENYTLAAKNLPSLFSLESKHFNPSHFTGFSKIKNLYITGHSDGTILFWDATCSFLIPLLSLIQQTEDGSSSSDVAVTAVYYCAELRILFTGDKSGMVRTYQFKPEPFAMENAFFSFPGITKKGSNHVMQTVKYIKVNGPILYLTKSSSSKHLAVGCENGHISLIDVEGSSVLYHRQIETVLSADIISLQFECFSYHSLEKNILVAATLDSSILALDADTGNTLSSSAVHPKKRSRALLMKILDTSNEGLPEDTVQKPQSLLLCSEKAAYVYSLPHAVHGEKKVCYKKNFHSSSCYWASVINISSRVGVMFLFACGKFEIRSLPELSLVKEATLKSFQHIPVQQNYVAGYFLCSSPDGEVIMTRGDQEISVASMLLDSESYRQLDYFSQIYDKNLIASEDGLAAASVHPKEKKKGIFGTVPAGSKTIHGAGNVSARTEELSIIFSNSNFPAPDEDSKVLEVDGGELDIDDIDVDDLDEKPKRHNVTALLDKQKLASKFHSFKGKLKQRTMRNEKPSAQEDPTNGKDEAVDQIKRKYGYSSSSDSSLAKMVQSKLADNVKRLQGISVKTAEIQDDASTFSSMAKETLRAAEHKSQK